MKKIKKWTIEEFETAVNLLKNGKTLKEISTQLKRTIVSIKCKFSKEKVSIQSIKYPLIECICKQCKETFTTKTYFNRSFCSKSCAAIHNNSKKDKESYLKVSKRLKEIGHRPPSRKTTKIEKTCPICKNTFQVSSSRKDRIFCSKKCRDVDYAEGYKFSKKPKPHGKGGYRENSTRKHRQIYNGFWMDSGSEKTFAELLDKEGIKWLKNTNRFFEFKDDFGKVRKYYPDFYLPEYDLWVEIKGRYYERADLSKKLEAVGTNIELIYHDEIRVPSQIIR